MKEKNLTDSKKNFISKLANGENIYLISHHASISDVMFFSGFVTQTDMEPWTWHSEK